GRVKLRLVAPAEPTVPDTAGASPAFRYWAFLSYSHHDKAIARRLQKQLEIYRVPKRLVGRETPHGAVPARVSPVFRDRDELHAGSDLKASVQDALSRSRWLIVVCTPDSARSPWVNREIIEFKKLHGERRVLALIARGEPFASDLPGREAEECFPPALRRALTPEGKAEGEALEPIAADMRREGDGAHRATLKLLAGMLGVPFDELVRRDVQRRVRWLTALASASVAGVVVFAFLAVMAVQARNEAQYQRQQAEGLIEFMLGDLRKKLEPVGRLEVLDSVGEKALGYYGGQDAGKLDATALGHRSRAMHLIGEIRDLRGQPIEAQKAFEQAAETTALLLAKAPDDPQRIFDHAQSVYWVGYAAWKRADGAAAEQSFREYLRLAERLVVLDSANPDWRAEVGFAHSNLGTVLLDMGRLGEAVAALTKAGDAFVDLTAKRPELRFELAQTYGWLSDAHALAGNYRMALQEQRRKQAIFGAVDPSEKNAVAQRGLLSSLNEISLYELSLGNVVEAERNSANAVRLAADLLQTDGENQFWRSHACIAWLRLVETQIAMGRAAVALESFRQGASCVQRFNLTGTPGLSDEIRLNARRLALAPMFAETREQRLALLDEMERFVATSIPKIRADVPDRIKLSAEVAQVSLAASRLRTSAAGLDAAPSLEVARQLLEPFSTSNDGAVLTPLAEARLGLGDTLGASALVDKIQKSFYRHPALADLVNRLHAEQGGRITSPITGVQR
ncbi:MAG TPA: toll/interleukin-1 receptor domain-containing protein, partial [Rhizobacter sp.]